MDREVFEAAVERAAADHAVPFVLVLYRDGCSLEQFALALTDKDSEVAREILFPAIHAALAVLQPRVEELYNK